MVIVLPAVEGVGAPGRGAAGGMTVDEMTVTTGGSKLQLAHHHHHHHHHHHLGGDEEDASPRRPASASPPGGGSAPPAGSAPLPPATLHHLPTHHQTTQQQRSSRFMITDILAGGHGPSSSPAPAGVNGPGAGVGVGLALPPPPPALAPGAGAPRSPCSSPASSSDGPRDLSLHCRDGDLSDGHESGTDSGLPGDASSVCSNGECQCSRHVRPYFAPQEIPAVRVKKKKEVSHGL
ncbi:hypothetical protein R5R35_007631 [Gryllus longicercus]|uniref:Uncharacterized protein n=1 Tax=Gryllus longicercus TaxID=2509291 RepID=A0AAN9VCA2_9ORTH